MTRHYEIRNRQGVVKSFNAADKAEAIPIAEAARNNGVTSTLYRLSNPEDGAEIAIWVMPGANDYRAQGRMGLCSEEEDF